MMQEDRGTRLGGCQIMIRKNWVREERQKSGGNNKSSAMRREERQNVQLIVNVLLLCEENKRTLCTQSMDAEHAMVGTGRHRSAAGRHRAHAC